MLLEEHVIVHLGVCLQHRDGLVYRFHVIPLIVIISLNYSLGSHLHLCLCLDLILDECEKSRVLLQDLVVQELDHFVVAKEI